MQHDDKSQPSAAVALDEQLHTLKQQLLTELRAEQHRAARWHGARMFVMGAVVALAGGAMTAVAQTVADDLRTFSAGQPALASDVNWNFSLLRQWIEHKLGDPKSPIVTMNKALVHACVNCGSQSVVNGDQSWGNLVVQGRVLSASSNIHLSPPPGASVVIDDNYRAAGGAGLPASGAASLSVEGNIATGGTLSSGGDLTVSGKTLANHIRDYVRTQCSIHLGWADSCDGGCDGNPSKYGSSRADGTCNTVVGGDSECANSWVGINFDGDVNGDDKIFARLLCN